MSWPAKCSLPVAVRGSKIAHFYAHFYDSSHGFYNKPMSVVLF